MPATRRNCSTLSNMVWTSPKNCWRKRHGSKSGLKCQSCTLATAVWCWTLVIPPLSSGGKRWRGWSRFENWSTYSVLITGESRGDAESLKLFRLYNGIGAGNHVIIIVCWLIEFDIQCLLHSLAHSWVFQGARIDIHAFFETVSRCLHQARPPFCRWCDSCHGAECSCSLWNSLYCSV